MTIKKELKNKADLEELIANRSEEIYVIVRDFLKKKNIKYPSDDLMQDMVVGFLSYARHFDDVHQVKPLTYLYKCLDGILKRRGKTNSLIKPSMAYHAKILEAVRLKKESTGASSVSMLEIAKEVGCSIEAVERTLGYIHSVDSFSDSSSDDRNSWDIVSENTPSLQVRSPAEEIKENDFIETILSVLPVEVAFIIKSRVGIFPHRSLQDLGLIFELSKERIRQIEEDALHKLRQTILYEVDETERPALLRLILDKELGIKRKKDDSEDFERDDSGLERDLESGQSQTDSEPEYTESVEDGL